MSEPVGFAGGSDGNAGRKKVGRVKRSKRKAKYVEGLKRGLTQTDAALAADYSPTVARNTKAKLHTPDVVEEIAEFRGSIARAFPSPRLIKTLDEGLGATKVVTASYEGKITDEVAYVDQGERRKTVELIAKLSGRISSEPSVTVNPTFNVIIRDVGAGPARSGNMASAETKTIVQSS